jgi:hypothetical protein
MNIELSSVICMYEFKFEYMYDVIKDKNKNKKKRYLDVIFMTSDRRLLTDVVRTLVSGRRRCDLHTTNTRRRVPTGIGFRFLF